MMQVRWTAPALADLDLIQDYIAEGNPPAASILTVMHGAREWPEGFD